MYSFNDKKHVGHMRINETETEEHVGYLAKLRDLEIFMFLMVTHKDGEELKETIVVDRKTGCVHGRAAIESEMDDYYDMLLEDLKFQRKHFMQILKVMYEVIPEELINDIIAEQGTHATVPEPKILEEWKRG